MMWKRAILQSYPQCKEADWGKKQQHCGTFYSIIRIPLEGQSQPLKEEKKVD